MEKQILGLEPTSYLNMSTTNITSACKIANIGPDDAMILSYDANPDRMEFSERTTVTIILRQREFANDG